MKQELAVEYGTANNPYVASTAEQLSAIKWFTEAHFILDAHIDMAGYGKTENSEASGAVTGISVNGIASHQIGGLIGQGYALNSNATGTVTGGHEVGGLIGSGSARRSFATGNITATGDYVGGLIGDLNHFSEQGSELPEYSTGEPAGLSASDLKNDQITTIQ